MAAASGRSKRWSLVTQIGQLHRWSVSTMDGDDSTGTSFLGNRYWVEGGWFILFTGDIWCCLLRLGPGDRLILSHWVDVPLTNRYDSIYSPPWASVVGLNTRPRLGIQLVLVCWLTLSLRWPKALRRSGLDRIRLPQPDCSLRASRFLYTGRVLVRGRCCRLLISQQRHGSVPPKRG